MGRDIGKSAKTVGRWLYPAEEYEKQLLNIAKRTFAKSKKLFYILDDTLLRKEFSEYIEGTDDFYDTKRNQLLRGIKLLVGMISDGKQSLPINNTFLFSTKQRTDQKEIKREWIENSILLMKKEFSHTEFTVVADGAFATKKFFEWCRENGIRAETRIRSNAKVTIADQKISLKDIEQLKHKGRQKHRTVEVIWHGLSLFITAEKRIDKRGTESVVFQASTFHARPDYHVKVYKIRWNIEKMFRTTKQSLGLQNCFSTKRETQKSHITAVFLAYSFLQIDHLKRRLPTPEAALRAPKHKNAISKSLVLRRLDRVIQSIYV